MKVTMVVPSYWGRRAQEELLKTDTIYDHPTPLGEEGTLGRLLDSIAILKNRDFRLLILGVATAKDIQEDVEDKVSSLIRATVPAVETLFFSYSHLEKIHTFLSRNQKEDKAALLQLNGYSNIRNLCMFLPHLLGSEAAVLIDDDELFEDPLFMDKALEFIGKEYNGDRVLAVAGYYVNPDDDFYLNRNIPAWMTYWNKIDCMNRAFKEIIAQEPRLKVTPFAFGGNMVIHRDLFMSVPFDPLITRGEDIDFLINARMFGHNVYLDNTLSIKHKAPPKTSPIWQQVREDIFRFVFEKRKLEAQQPRQGMQIVNAEDLDPYPGEFLKQDLEERIFRSNQMLAVDYLSKGGLEGAQECLNNISVAVTRAAPRKDPFMNLLQFQKSWKGLMEFFAEEKTAREATVSLW